MRHQQMPGLRRQQLTVSDLSGSMRVLVCQEYNQKIMRAMALTAVKTGFFLLFMGLLNLVFLICSLKTDIVHVVIFVTLVVAFGLLTGEYFNIALGNLEVAGLLTVVRIPSRSSFYLSF